MTPAPTADPVPADPPGPHPLAARQAHLREILAASAVAAAFEWDAGRQLIAGDARFAHFLGLDPEAALAGITPAAFYARLHAGDRTRIRLAIGGLLRGADVLDKECRLVASDGTVRWVHAHARGTGLDGLGGAPDARFEGVLVDITGQKHVEERLRIAQDSGGVGTFEHVDGDGTAFVSGQFCRLLGLTPAQDLSIRAINACVLPGQPLLIDPVGGRAPGLVNQAEFQIRRRDTAEERWLMRRGECVRDTDTASLRFSGVIYDITDTKQTEQALRALNDTLEQHVEARTRERDQIWRASTDMLCVADFRGHLVSLNPAWAATLGWTDAEMRAVPFIEFVHPDDREATLLAASALQRGAPALGFENRYRHRDGTYRWLSWNAVSRDGAIYATVRDVTAARLHEETRERLEEQLRQSSKMEAVGHLTGGIAHDFNNLLTGITGSLDLLQTRLTQGRLETLPRYIAAAQGAAQRAAALTHRLLAFSRRQTLDPKPVDANRLVADMEDLVRRTVGPEIAVETVRAIGLWTIRCDPNQLENAILNLCINARDAMPHGGRMTIETSNTTLDERAARDRDMQPGPYVAIAVTDTGTGMSADVIARAFDPFFTTKPIGHGTGLGLSMIYGFTKQSGGQVRISSELGAGTTMRLYLPRHGGQETDDPEPEPDHAHLPRARGGETVLVVDDEPTVRMLVAEVLEELGYTTIEAADGAAALAVLQQSGRIDLLITDVGLPGGLNGCQLADAARLTRTGLKVLFITGYAENAVLGHGHLEPGMHVVTKPFSMEQLATRIEAVIAGA